MLDVKVLRQSTESMAALINKRGLIFDIAKFNALEDKRKLLQVKMQELQNERNVKSKEVGLAKATGKNVDDTMSHLKQLSEEIKSVEEQFAKVQLEVDDFLAIIPNITHESVPIGKGEEDNQEIRKWGEPRKFSFQPKDHVELGAPHGWIDFETGAKLSGARFVVIRGVMAKLQRALMQFMLDIHINEHGYQEISVPFILNEECFFGTGQLPKMKEDLFAIKGEEGRQYLIPTAEVPVTNTVRDEILEANQLPIKYTCLSSCFRSEAGSYGKDMRGMLRQHQFEKVELVQIVHPDKSYAVLEELTGHAEKILQRLELPYRVMVLSTGDIGFASAKTYDLEVWLPGQDRYREISSCSNMESFQARRMKARFRDEAGKIDLVHTLNGSGLAIGRTLIAVLENNQDESGCIHIPKALQPYMGGLTVITP